jgi:hypothetical protein
VQMLITDESADPEVVKAFEAEGVAVESV